MTAELPAADRDRPPLKREAPRRRGAGWKLIVHFATLGVAIGASFLTRMPAAQSRVPGSWLMASLIVAAVIAAAMLRWLEGRHPEPVRSAGRSAPRASFSKQSWAGALVLLLALALAGWVVYRLWPNYREWQGTVLPWLASLALALAGGKLLGRFVAADREETGATPGIPAAVDGPPRWLEVVLFLVIAAVAVAVRVHRIDEIPIAVFGDETEGGMDALRILEERNISPFATGWAQIPQGYAYYMAGLVELLGANTSMLKTASLLPAILTVLAVYPLGRALFGPWAGLCAMSLMATSRWHMTMSRWGWIEIATPFLQVLALYLLVRGLRRRSALAFVSGGLVAGLMMYTYLTARLAVVTLLLAGALWMLLDSAGPIAGVRRHATGILCFVLAFAIAFGPLAVTYITDPPTFGTRVKQLSVFGEMEQVGSWEPLRRGIVRHVQSFHQRGDTNGRHNLPAEPHLDPVAGALFVVALAYGLLRITDPRWALLLVWLVIAMSAGYLSWSQEAPHAFRTINAVPAVALMTGAIIAASRRCLVRSVPSSGRLAAAAPPRRWRSALGALVLLLPLVASSIWETRKYFGAQAASVAVHSAFHLGPTQAAAEIGEALAAGDRVLLSPPFYHLAIVRFLTYGANRARTGSASLGEPGFEPIRPETDLPLLDTGQDVLLILDSSYWPLRDYMRFLYPKSQIDYVEGAVSPSDLYVRVRISADDLAAIKGLRPAAGISRPSGATAVAHQLPAAVWSGAIRIPKSGEYDFVVPDDTELEVDGASWDGARFLGSGLHPLRTAGAPSAGPPAVQWRGPGLEGEVPPQAMFAIAPPPQGLLAAYYDGPSWEGELRFSQILPFLTLHWPPEEPWQGPFSVRLSGLLRVPSSGAYSFLINADDGVRLWIDGELLAESVVQYQPNSIRASTALEAGEHPIVIEYFQMGGASGLNVFWQTPGAAMEAIPSGALVPAARSGTG